jgi:Xaa-Pro aminopeptidase
LLNIRGNDSKYTPIPYSYILIDKKKNINFFCDLKKIPTSFKKNFNKIKFINIKDTNLILSQIYKKNIIIDKNTCSIYYESIILKNNKICKQQDPIYALKAIKTKKEIENIKRAHIYDGAALTKYLFWLKNNFLKKKITEISAEKKLFNFRKQNKNFNFLSFPTISGTGPNGAIIHYKASKSTNRKLEKGDIYLVDSGGQYNYGTTDVTRTISLKNLNKRIKNIFTRVLKGHIAVANFTLKKKTSGSTIDGVARKYLKQIDLDYAHGTGHGVGYFLNVHEGPHAISRGNKVIFKEGMVVSNEPGYYEKNNFGIRIENLIYVKRIRKSNYFRNLTMAPIDKELIDLKILNKKEKIWLNNYHKKVFDNLKKFMNKAEFLQLNKSCSAI